VKVQCPGCRIALTIPDEKIPDGKAVRMPCPKCKVPVEISRKQPESATQEYAATGSMPSLSDSYSDYAGAVDVVEDGVKTALLCVGTRLGEKIAQVLQELDFWVVHASRSGFALGKLHHNNYDLLILEDTFDSAQTGNNLVLHHVQLLPMHVRRQFFLCLFSETLPSMDSILAFQMGVNLILNIKDLEKAKIILARSLKEYKSFYGYFNAEMNKKSF